MLTCGYLPPTRHYVGCVEYVDIQCVTLYSQFQSKVNCDSMHSVEELGTNVPAFLAKLWKMVEDSETNDLICWSPSGNSFHISDQARFARHLLPVYYKHNNMASFVRQLNMYGFHKVVSIESGGLKADRDDMEFAHQCFIMGHPYLLEHIKRKIPTNKSEDGRAGSKTEIVNKVLSEVKSLKGRQDSVDSQLNEMKRENEVLWREVAILRQKHLKQQQIVNKLIQFLVSMVQTSRGGGIGIKRHYPLMLNDSTHHSTNTSSKLNGNIAGGKSMQSNSSPTGPVIHELDPTELLEDCAPVMDEGNSAPVFDLCGAVNQQASSDPAASSETLTTSDPSASTVSPNTTASTTVLNGSVLEEQTPDVLLELVEECPLNNNALVTAVNVQSFLGPTKPKGKQKLASFKGTKKRKSKLMPSVSKTTNPLIAIKTERAYPEEPVNVNNFLEIMLPSLVNDEHNNKKPQETCVSGSSEGEVILPDLCEESLENNDQDKQNSLEAATDAAISAISNVAAAQAAAAAATSSKAKAATPTTTTSKTSIAGQKLGSSASAEEEYGTNNKDLTLACAGSGESYANRIDAHVENMQTELESLKELLKGDACNLDANVLLGVCAAGLGIDPNTFKLFGDDSLSFSIPFVQDENSGKDTKQNGVSDPMVSGSELMTYSSNLMDFDDMSEFDDTWTTPAAIFSEDTNDELNTPVVSISAPGFSGSPAAKKKKITK